MQYLVVQLFRDLSLIEFLLFYKYSIQMLKKGEIKIKVLFIGFLCLGLEVIDIIFIIYVLLVKLVI